MNARASISHFRARLFARVDGASLAAFRVAFGAIMFCEMLRYFSHGWIARYWIVPAFHFSYPGFAWVKPWLGIGMYAHMGALALLAVFIAIGLFYRVSTVLFFLGFTYVFLLERALYLNHFYFVCLVSLLMIFVPANRTFSVDARIRRPVRVGTVPFWSIWILRMQLAVVYIYAGIAKLNSDWVQGEPLRSWLHDQRSTPVVGSFFERPEAYDIVSWGGLAFDLLIVPLLLWRRTRGFAFVAAVCFHLMNAWFFRIGIFPWFSIAMTTLFFEPDWPRSIFRRLGIGSNPGALTILDEPPPSLPRRRLMLALISLYTALQLLLPFRHWLYPGDVAWTEEGHEFSWRMKLRGKSGSASFVVTNPATGESWRVSPYEYLEEWQVSKMTPRPELIRQFAHYLAKIEEEREGTPVEVRVDSIAKLNHRPPEMMIDPNVDLGKEPYRIGAAKWIVRRAVR